MLLREVHEDLPRLDADRVRGNAQFVVEGTGSGGGIELPRVPGASDERSFERALAERTAVMRAHARQSAHIARDIAQRVEIVVLDDFEESARGKFVDRCYFPKSHPQ